MGRVKDLLAYLEGKEGEQRAVLREEGTNSGK